MADRWPLSCLVVATALCVGACGEEGARPDGGGGPDGSVDGTWPLPDLRPCPAGWREAGAAPDAITCEPWPEAGRALCTGDEAHFPGTPGCARVGPACPTGPFPDDLPVDAPVTYVSPGATGGDGTRANPFGSVYEATSGATDGGTVALARGTYTDAARLGPGVTLRGACVADTVVLNGEVLGTGGATVRDLRMVDSDGTAIGATEGTIHIENVVIEGGYYGVNTSSGGVTANGLVIRNVTTGVQSLGAGIELRRTSIEQTSEHGVFIVESAGQTSLIEDTVITGVGAMALAAWVADMVTVRRTVIEDTGLAVGAIEAQVQLEQGVVRDGAMPPAGVERGGFGVVVQDGLESSSMRRMLLERLRQVAVHVENSGLTVADTVIRDVLPDFCADSTCAGEAGGSGVVAVANASIDLSHFLVDRAALCGLHVTPEGEIDAADGQVSGCAIGACIQADGFDTARLSERVLYWDNGTNLDSVDLPIPNPLGSIAL